MRSNATPFSVNAIYCQYIYTYHASSAVKSLGAVFIGTLVLHKHFAVFTNQFLGAITLVATYQVPAFPTVSTRLTGAFVDTQLTAASCIPFSAFTSKSVVTVDTGAAIVTWV